jgi:alpha-tubulin suppressor-like RCC1 family protein
VTAPTAPAQLSPTASTSLATASKATCVIATTATSYCWGGGNGEVGDSARANQLAPTVIAGRHDFAAIAAGNLTVCGLDRSGTPWCWGEDPTQPGVASALALVPVRIYVPVPLVTITVGRKFACGLAADGTAYCWGENGRGQLGVGDTLRRDGTTVVPGIHFTQIAAGFWHACGIDVHGKTLCWGDNQYAELATGETNTRYSATPRAIAGDVGFSSVAPGSVHTCALKADGVAYCWGSNFGGHLGDGTSTFRLSPVPVSTTQRFTLLRASRANDIYSHTCGVTSAGDVYCWGYDGRGELGTATATDECINVTDGTSAELCSYTPVKIAGLSNVRVLDTGDGHSCALTTSSQLYCWGSNSAGQLGDGTQDTRLTPVLVTGSLKLP